MEPGTLSGSELFAGLQATASGVRAAVASRDKLIDESVFPLTVDGFESLVGWLRLAAVRKLALLQGKLAWPWQVEKARRRSLSGPIDLAFWLEHEGPDALSRVSPEAAWQPVMLALRERFVLFLVTSSANGGRYPIPLDRTAPAALATMLAKGDFIEEYPKQWLERLVADLAAGQPGALDECLSFFCAESRGHWHNRARAKMARRLKHRDLSETQSQRLVEVIGRRLVEGRFSEQFKDQLGLMLKLDGEASRRAAGLARQSHLPYVQRYGAWLDTGRV